MRALWIGFAALLVTSAPAAAAGVMATPGHIIPYATMDTGGAGVLTVNRGDRFAIACDDIKAQSANVSVVMSLANPPGEAPTGYSSVLVTNQTVARHAVHVQVPDTPDLANHTVIVKVYVTDAKGTHACDAGKVHIA
ncbi:MAG TPA: hypothetical protein VNU97_06635 [Rhizomicrobium sp.]|nr:hypothetical protein [Rhizomicrobium sp.]